MSLAGITRIFRLLMYPVLLACVGYGLGAVGAGRVGAAGVGSGGTGTGGAGAGDTDTGGAGSGGGVAGVCRRSVDSAETSA